MSGASPSNAFISNNKTANPGEESAVTSIATARTPTVRPDSTGLRFHYGPARVGDVRDSQADISRARELLGYEPIVLFEEGLRRTIEWYRTQVATLAQT